MSPVGLGDLLRDLHAGDDPNLLVGFETNDDAAAYRLSDDTAVLMTADIITPPVDDPYVFGQIAAANALSDVYAMGGRPLACLNLVGFPSGQLEQTVLRQIIQGAASKIIEAGAVLVGGHTMEDEEPKFGLSVTGLGHPERLWTNRGALPGDVLVLTKPIGSGVLLNANRKGRVSSEALERCLEALTTLNRTSAQILSRFTVHAVTDVTGFGLAGHGFEMAHSSGVTLHIQVDEVPVFAEAAEAYERGETTGVNVANREGVNGRIRFDRPLVLWREELVFDPQTSGGLLAAVPEAEADDLLRALWEGGVADARRIGHVASPEHDCALAFE